MATTKGIEVANAILVITEKNGIAPTVKDIAKTLGYRSLSALYGQLDRLENSGVIS